MSESKLTSSVLKNLADDFYAADGFFGAFDLVFGEKCRQMRLDLLALSHAQDVPEVFDIAPGPFEGDEENTSGDCHQYNTPHSNLRFILNEPFGYIKFEINYLIDVPQEAKRFWAKCSRGNDVMPQIQLFGAYESITDIHELAEAILHDLFVIQIDTNSSNRS